MEVKKHGMNLVNLLSEYNGELVGVDETPFPENSNGYGLQTLILTYQNGKRQQIRVGVTLVSEKVKHKKNTPTTSTNLSVVDLSRVQYSEYLISMLLRKNTASGITDLFTSKYMISDGSPAICAYDQLNAVPPENTKDLVEVLRNSSVRNSYRTHQGAASMIPDPSLRLNLGRF